MDMNSIIMQMLQSGGGQMFGGPAGGGMPPPAPTGAPQPGAGAGLPFPRPGMLGPPGGLQGDPSSILAAMGGQPGGMGAMGGMPRPPLSHLAMQRLGNRFGSTQGPQQSQVGGIVRNHFNSIGTPPAHRSSPLSEMRNRYR